MRILQSTSLIRGKTESLRESTLCRNHFNPLPSSEGRQLPIACLVHSGGNFNPLPSSEGRLNVIVLFLLAKILQSTSLIRGKTSPGSFYIRPPDHFNPLPSSEGRLYPPKTSHPPVYFNPLPSSEGRLRLGPMSRFSAS